MQETFLRAWRGRDGFDGSTMVRAWLYRIATNVCLDLLRSRSRHLTHDAHLRRGAVAPAVSGPAARRGRADRGRAGLGRGRARDHRARVPRRDAGAAAETTGRPDRPGRARLAGERDGDAPRDERGGRQQRAAACARDDERASAREALRVVGRLAERRGARPARPVHRCARALRRAGRHRHLGPGPAHHDAAVPVPVRGYRCHRPAHRRRAARGRVAAARHVGQPDADRRELPPEGRATRSSGRSSSMSCGSSDGKIAEITTFGPELFGVFGLPRRSSRTDRPAASSPCGTSAPSPRRRPRPRRSPPRGRCTGRAT